jgi:hypothetical protein
MSHRSPASSLELLLCAALLAACGEDGDSSDDSTAAAGSTSAATTTGGSTTEPTTGEPPPGTTTDGATTDLATTTDPSSTTGDGVCGDNMLTWDNFGEAFMLSWCTGCHNSALPTAQRAGAPCGINFDSHAGALPFAANIEVRAIDWQMYEGATPMPPAAIVPDDELALLREWIDCGAPGPGAELPAPTCPDP